MMTASHLHRRNFLRIAALCLGASAAISRALAASCVDPDGSDASLRQSLHYTETSPSPSQKCAGCGFFSEPKGNCGKCQIFGGPANANGHCDSWTAKG
jgi:hypothetical protein